MSLGRVYRRYHFSRLCLPRATLDWGYLSLFQARSTACPMPILDFRIACATVEQNLKFLFVVTILIDSMGLLAIFDETPALQNPYHSLSLSSTKHPFPSLIFLVFGMFLQDVFLQSLITNTRYHCYLKVAMSLKVKQWSFTEQALASYSF